MIPPEENQSSQFGSEDEVHTGYDFESGVLARVREWNDVFPWLRLGRTLRAAGSPPLLMLVAVTFAIWAYGAERINGISQPVAYDTQLTVRQATQSAIELPKFDSLHSIVWAVGRRIEQSTPVALFPAHGWKKETSPPFWQTLAAIVWSLIIWMPATLLLLRQGALLTAGRPMVGFVAGLQTAGRRCPFAYLMSFVPLACVCVIGFALLLTAWASRMGVWIETPLSLFAALIAVVCGILAFGSYFAVPIGWAALVNEKEPDVLDSLSRGYEYLYRRPMQMAMYLCITIVILLVVVFFAEGVGLVGAKVSITMMELAGASDSMIATTRSHLRLFPFVVSMTLFWSLVGGVYLLLRRDAGGQEIEDLWQPTSLPTKPLPKIPTNN